MKMINANVSETEWDEMKAAKHHCRRVKAVYEAIIDNPTTSEPTVQIPESLWNAIEALIKDEDIRTDLLKEQHNEKSTF